MADHISNSSEGSNEGAVTQTCHYTEEGTAFIRKLLDDEFRIRDLHPDVFSKDLPIARDTVECIKDAPEIFKAQVEAAMAEEEIDSSDYEICASNVTIDYLKRRELEQPALDRFDGEVATALELPREVWTDFMSQKYDSLDHQAVSQIARTPHESVRSAINNAGMWYDDNVPMKSGTPESHYASYQRNYSELREHVRPRYASQVATNGDSGKSAPKGDDTSSEEADSSSGEEEELSEDDAVHSGQE